MLIFAKLSHSFIELHQSLSLISSTGSPYSTGHEHPEGYAKFMTLDKMIRGCCLFFF